MFEQNDLKNLGYLYTSLGLFSIMRYVSTKSLDILKELERSGTIPIVLTLDQLKEGKFTDIHHESIRMGFRVGSGVISRKLKYLCEIGWVQRKDKRNKIFSLTEKGLGISKSLKEFIRNLEKKFPQNNDPVIQQLS